MLVAPGPAHAVKPRVQRTVVVLDVEILCRLELKRLVTGHVADARPATDGLLSGWRAVSHEHLHVHHVMLLHMHRLVVVSAVEYQVPWPQLLLFQLDRQCVKLIGLISPTECEIEFDPEITDSPRNQRAAVKEERRVVHWVIRLQAPLGIRDAHIRLALLDEALAKPILVGLGAPAPLICLGVRSFELSSPKHGFVAVRGQRGQ